MNVYIFPKRKVAKRLFEGQAWLEVVKSSKLLEFMARRECTLNDYHIGLIWRKGINNLSRIQV